MLSASIAGNVYTVINGGQVGLAAQTVFLDLNHNGKFGSTVSPFTANTPISGSTGTSLDGFMAELTSFGFGAVVGSAVTAQNLPSTFQDVSVGMTLVNNSPDPIFVNLVSPLDQNIPNLPILFTIQPGQTFDGAFDGNSTNLITLAPNLTQPGSTISGTFAPQQAFTNPQFGINNSNPNGDWGLVFYGGTASDYNQLSLTNFSLNFTIPEPNTQTDAAGNYSLTGLPSGTTTDDVALALPSGETVTSRATDSSGRLNFGVQTAPDLTTTSFRLNTPATAFGQPAPITVQYTLTNEGAGAAPGFNVGLYLSSNGVITANPSLLLGTLHFDGTDPTLPDGLAAGASFSGSMTVALPAAAPSSAFDVLSSDYVGFVIDPTNSITESAANQSNQGAGIDLALLGSPTNVAVTTNTGVQQDPSVAVDPGDSSHLVTAYLDYSSTQGQTSSSLGVSAGSATVTPLVMEPDIVKGAYLLIDKGLAEQETVQVTGVTTTTFTATFAQSHNGGFTIDSLLYAGVGVAVSTNGGKTWTNSTTPIALPAGYDQGASNPTVAFDTLGNVYVSFMAATYVPATAAALPAVTGTDLTPSSRVNVGFTSSNGIFVAKSTDGGQSWLQPTAVDTNLYTGTAVPFDEYPDMAIDTIAGSPYLGSIYVTWTTFYPADEFPGDAGSTGGSQLMIAISSNQGSSFKTQMQNVPGTGPATGLVSAIQDPSGGVGGGTEYDGPGSFDKFTTITVGAGAVYVTAFSGGNATIFYSKSGGRSSGGGMVSSFVPPNYAAQVGIYPLENEFLLTDAKLGVDQFRTLKQRHLIVADPNNAGVLYAVAPNSLDTTPSGGVEASGITFFVSNDYGQTWTSNYTIGSEGSLLAEVPVGSLGTYVPVLNDENGGAYPGFASSQQNQVIAYQAMPSITVNAQGDIVVIWYDTRNDPTGQNLEVWGTVSTDGGQHFSSNFPVTNTSFNPNNGAFTSPNGSTSFYLGDQIGVTSSNTTAYAVWTDTRNGNQDVYSASFNLNPQPAAPPDRFSPNNTPGTATNLGTATVQQEVPRLALPPGTSDEWFSFQAGASNVSISVNAASGGDKLRLALTDADGNPILGANVTNAVDANGVITGQVLVALSTPGTTYLIHVSSQSDTAIDYSLTLGSLTGDLGTQVEDSLSSTVTTGGQNIYRVAAAVTGTLVVNLTGSNIQGTGLTLSILGADGQTVLASSLIGVDPNNGNAVVAPPNSNGQLDVHVTQGQVVLLQVSAADATSSGDFTLQLTNLDEYETTIGTGNLAQGSGQVTQGNVENYTFTAAAAGTLQVTLNAGADIQGNLRFKILAPDGAVLVPYAVEAAGQSVQRSISVTQGEEVVIRVSGALLSSAEGDYTLELADSNSILFFPTVGDPSSIAAVDLGNGQTDLLVSNTDAADSLGVLVGNADGTFSAESQYGVGPGLGSANLTAGNRQFAVADLTGSSTSDVIVPNLRSGDVSVLLGNGDATFQPQRRFNGVGGPGAVATGVFTSSGFNDAIVLQNFAQTGTSSFAFLRGNGDGTFQPPVLYSTVFDQGATGIVVGAFGNPDHAKNQTNLDLIIYSKNSPNAQIFYGNGDGTFTNGGVFFTGETTFNATTAVIDGHLDLITAGTVSGHVYVLVGNGYGAFQSPVAYLAMEPNPGDNVGITGLAVTGFDNASPSDPLNIVVTAESRSGQGAAEVIMLPGNGDGTFGDPIVLATVGTAGNIAVDPLGKFLAVADKGGVTVIYSSPLNLSPNTSSNAARNLGDADHLISQPQAIVTDHQNAYFTYTVPTESAPGAGDQVVDISALFQNTTGSGLSLQVTGGGQVLQTYSNSTSGDRIRVVAAQGSVLTIHVSSASGGFGVYTLDVDVLPQVVSVQAESALPGGPATSIVLTLQGDLLDPTFAEAAQDPANYFTVTYEGPNGDLNIPIPIATMGGGQPVVYDDSADVNTDSGLTYQTEARQTITLLFDSPLPAGTYKVALAQKIHTAAYNSNETGSLVDDATFGGHPIVSSTSTTGSVIITATSLVSSSGTPNPSDANSIGAGTAFLSQLQNDLSALLDSLIKQGASDAAITAAINNEIYARFLPQFEAGNLGTQTFGVIWLDPVSIGLVAPAQQPATGSNGLVTPSGAVNYTAGSSTATNTVQRTYIEVGGNVEVIVLANVVGTFNLDVKNVPAQARGGSVVLSALLSQITSFTDALQGGITSFTVVIPDAVNAVVAQAAVFDASGNSELTAEVRVLLYTTLSAGGSDGAGGAGTSSGAGANGPVAIATTQVAVFPQGKGDDGSDEVAALVQQQINLWLQSTFGGSSNGMGVAVDGLSTIMMSGGQAINQFMSDFIGFLTAPSVPLPAPPKQQQQQPEQDDGSEIQFQEQNTPEVLLEEPSFWETDACLLGLALASGVCLTSLREQRSIEAPGKKRWSGLTD
jgi:CARDB